MTTMAGTRQKAGKRGPRAVSKSSHLIHKHKEEKKTHTHREKCAFETSKATLPNFAQGVPPTVD